MCQARKFVGEIDTAGCALVYPTGPRASSRCAVTGPRSQCSSTMRARRQARRARRSCSTRSRIPSPKRACAPATPGLRHLHAARWCRSDATSAGTAPGKRWSLLDAADRRRRGGPGGMQHLACMPRTDRLYSLMHVGGEYTPQGSGHRGLGLRSCRQAPGAAHRARGPGHIDRHHAATPSRCCSRFSSARQKGGRLRSEGREAAARRSAKSDSRPRRWSPTEPPCYALDPDAFLDRRPRHRAAVRRAARAQARATGRVSVPRSADYRLLPPIRWSRPSPALVVCAGDRPSAYAARFRRCGGRSRCSPAALLALYAIAIAINLARGRTSIDCGCLSVGHRRRISRWMVGAQPAARGGRCCSRRAATVRGAHPARHGDHRRRAAGAAALYSAQSTLAAAPHAAMPGAAMTAAGWIAIVVLWIVVVVLALAVLALARQIGVLHERLQPVGALQLSHGLRIGEAAPSLDGHASCQRRDAASSASAHPRGLDTLVVFVSPTCPVCKSLLPALRSIRRREQRACDVVLASDGSRLEHTDFIAAEELEEFPYVLSEPLGIAFGAGRLPHAVLIDGAGIVRASGLVNSREHLDSLFEARERGVAIAAGMGSRGRAPGCSVSGDVAGRVDDRLSTRWSSAGVASWRRPRHGAACFESSARLLVGAAACRCSRQPRAAGDRQGAGRRPADCDYWRYCAIDGFLCACCGGSVTSVRPAPSRRRSRGSAPATMPPTAADYIVSYNDCCGKSSCGRCLCNRNEGDGPSTGRPLRTTTTGVSAATPTSRITAACRASSARSAVAMVRVLPGCLLGCLLVVTNAQADPARARQNYLLHCMGCHGETGVGLEGKVPSMHDTLAMLSRTPQGRYYVLRVPGVTQSTLSDADSPRS